MIVPRSRVNAIAGSPRTARTAATLDAYPPVPTLAIFQDRVAGLEESNRKLESFGLMASHELQAPLRAIDGYCNQLARALGDLLPVEANLHLQRVRESIGAMSDLIQDLLDFSRLGTGAPRCEHVSLAGTRKTATWVKGAGAGDEHSLVRRRSPEGNSGARWQRCAMAALLLAVTQAHAIEPVSVLATQAIAPPDVAQASHAFDLQVHTFRGTRWSQQAITAAVREAARVLAQCAIALASAELRILDAPRRLHFYYTPASRELLRSVETRKPAVFFVEDTRNEPAFDAEAIGLGNAKSRPELANTIWIAYGIRDLPHALAHELVHVLSDSGEHSDQPGNLLRPGTSPLDAQLTQAQCERMRLRGEVNGLLLRLP